jgi:hypothetical protein
MGTWCTLAVGLRICGHDLMKRKGMRSSNLHHPIGDGWLRLSSGAQRQPAQCMWRHQGRLIGVEPSALSGGSLAMRSTSTWSTEDGGSHHSLRGRRWGRARAGDEEVDMRKDGEVGEGRGLWCSSGFGSSPNGGGGRSSSSATKRARPRPSEMVRWRELETGARY